MPLSFILAIGNNQTKISSNNHHLEFRSSNAVLLANYKNISQKLHSPSIIHLVIRFGELTIQSNKESANTIVCSNLERSQKIALYDFES